MSRTPEIEAVLMLSDPCLSREDGDRLCAAMASDIDWYRVLGLLAAHRTAGIAWMNVLEHAIETRQRMRPGYFLKGLEIMFRGQRHMALEQIMYARYVMDELARHGMRSALLKGGAVALMAYRDPGARQFNDNDILIDRAQIEEVGATLKDMGYVQGSWDYAAGSVRPALRKEVVFLSITSHQTYSYMKAVPESSWLDAHRLDVHLSIDLMTANRTDDAVHELLNNSITVGEPPVRTLDPVDMLIFCCIHFYKEAMYIGEVRRLKDLVLYKLADLIGLLGLAAGRLYERTRHLGQEEAVYFALHHVDVLYPGRVDRGLLDALRPGSLEYIDQIYDGDRPVHHWTQGIVDRFFDASRAAELPVTGRERDVSNL